MSMKPVDAIKLFFKQLFRFALILGVVLGIYWLCLNLSWLWYTAKPKYERQAYGLNWKIDTRKAEEKGLEEHKPIALFFLKKDDAASDAIKKNIFPSKEFRAATTSFILMLVEEPRPDKKGNLDPRLKALYDEMIQRYGDTQFGVVMVATAQTKGGHRITRTVKYTDQSVPAFLDEIFGGKFVESKYKDIIPEYKGLGIVGEYWNKIFHKDAKKVRKVRKVRRVKKAPAASAVATKPAAATGTSAQESK